MRFAIGYPLRPMERGFFPTVRRHIARVAELYFPWPGFSSGRAALGEDGGFIDFDAQARLEAELYAFREAGVQLDLLLNSNCHGEEALSLALEKRVRSVLHHLQKTVGLPEVVTTASPAIAHMVKQAAPDIHVRASVNMRIGTVQGMAYLADLFDEYVLQRDINRRPAQLETLCAWARAQGKGVSLLVNSGCMRHCSGQTFHDNLVAHGTQVDALCNLSGFEAHTCWRYLQKDRAHWPTVMQATWIRPEDLHRYAPYIDVAKLATRMHPAPWAVLDAYASGHWQGNLLDLFEPGFAALFEPRIVENARIPAGWFDAVLACDQQCHRCDVCAKALNAALAEGEGADTGGAPGLWRPRC